MNRENFSKRARTNRLGKCKRTARPERREPGHSENVRRRYLRHKGEVLNRRGGNSAQGTSDKGGRKAPNDNRAGVSYYRQFGNWIQDLGVAIALALVIILFLYQPVKVEGTSMAPLLSDQERIFINKFVVSFRADGARRRGGVLVSAGPHEIVHQARGGVAGRNSRNSHGILFVDGKRFSEPYVPESYFDGSSYGPVRIPAGQYFVMGDHRDQLE